MHSFFFFNDTATTEIYTLSLHDALPICNMFLWIDRLNRFAEWFAQKKIHPFRKRALKKAEQWMVERLEGSDGLADRKSTRLNSSHLVISYAVFCLKKKNKHKQT